MLDQLFQTRVEKQDSKQGTFVIEPLSQGYGNTLGNSLRRVLLSGLKGAALVSVKIQGAKHKFSTVTGLKEDIVDLTLTLKQIRFRYEGDKPVTLNLDKTGPAVVTAKDIITPANVKIINPELVLGHLAAKSRLKMDLVLETGYGYSPAESHQSDKVGVIGLDSIFSPVIRVNYKVEATRVGRQTDLDRLILDIFTDGAIKPEEALKEAARILVRYFEQIVKPQKSDKAVPKTNPLPSDETLKLTLEEINLPTRVTNSLRKSGYGTVEDLTKASLDDLKKVKNLGEKSIKLVQDILAKKKFGIKEG